MADDIRKTIPQLDAGGVVSGSLFESAQPAQTSTGYASVKVTSDDIATYTNATKSYSALNTSAKQIIPAINEAASMGGVVQLTQAEYTALTTAEKMNGSIYKLTDKAIFYCLDEEYHAVKELLTSEYEALSTAEQNNGTIYIQTDAETTGSDIAVSDSDSMSIAEAIGAIGTMATASWTGTSSSAYGTNLTGAVTLTKGVYIVTIKTPVSDITPLIELHDNTNDRTFYYTNIPSQESFTIPIELTATTDIIVRSAASVAISYSYLERGGLFAVRIK